jgi:hypothetical protein
MSPLDISKSVICLNPEGKFGRMAHSSGSGDKYRPHQCTMFLLDASKYAISFTRKTLSLRLHKHQPRPIPPTNIRASIDRIHGFPKQMPGF